MGSTRKLRKVLCTFFAGVQTTVWPARDRQTNSSGFVVLSSLGAERKVYGAPTRIRRYEINRLNQEGNVKVDV